MLQDPTSWLALQSSPLAITLQGSAGTAQGQIIDAPPSTQGPVFDACDLGLAVVCPSPGLVFNQGNDGVGWTFQGSVSGTVLIYRLDFFLDSLDCLFKCWCLVP